MRIPKSWNEVDGNKYHFLEDIRDGSESIIVTKRWLKKKSRWHYEARERWLVESAIKFARDNQ